jgi:hypothetical protein
MKGWSRVCLHSLVLTGVNLGCIIAGFGVYYLLRPVNQIAVQAPLAAGLTIVVFATWSLLVRWLPVGGLSLHGRAEWFWTYLLALLWTPLIFVPLHFVTQGYLTSFSNIIATWLFQLPTNALALLIAGGMREKLFTQN